MILDHLKNAYKYINMNESFRKAFQFLTDNNLELLSSGKHEIDGDDIFANVQEYQTNLLENTNWESHDKYADIQFIVQGREKIGWCDVEKLTVKENRSEENDIIFYENGSEPFTESLISPYEFSIYYPGEAHRPCICCQKPESVKKIVIKIKHFHD